MSQSFYQRKLFPDRKKIWKILFGTVLTHIVFFICSSSFKEPSAHVTSVKTILESHASYLMSGKELSKLVAFVKGTQFDLVVGKSFF